MLSHPTFSMEKETGLITKQNVRNKNWARITAHKYLTIFGLTERSAVIHAKNA